MLHYIVRVTRLIDEEWSSPRTKGYPLIGFPFPVVAIVGAYLLFILYVGPRLMRDRPPFRIEKPIIIHNILQILLTSFSTIASIRACYWPPNYSLWCQPIDKTDSPEAVHVANLVWIWYMTKIIDLLDTLFIVLRKKDSQLSILHIYHHSGMVIVGWAGVKYVPGGHSILLGTINSTVHVIMYSYYLLTAIDKRYARSWWKKYITQLQFVQFALVSIHHMIPIFTDCDYPKPISVMVVLSCFTVTLLFANFYYQTYLRPKLKQEEKKSK